MANKGATYQAAGIDNFAAGGFTGDATATIVTVGFKARYVKVFNETDAITWEWVKGMAATKSFKTVTAGTLTVDATSAIVDNDDGTFTIAAATAAAAKVLTWVAFA